jgi:predicted nuclease with RNAse H fold
MKNQLPNRPLPSTKKLQATAASIRTLQPGKAMKRDIARWIGADPGGNGNFGIAVLSPGGSHWSFTVDCADDAVQLIHERFDLDLFGIGIDAPMWWSSGPSGARQADTWIRSRYKLSGGQVQTCNSLQGAVLVQGAMFLKRMRERLPGVPATECHPKVLLKVLTSDKWSAFAKAFGVPAECGNEHERDALISAIAAREGFQGKWPRDLSLDRQIAEQDPSAYWLAPVHYFWPE